jgi:hypothetical protein
LRTFNATSRFSNMTGKWQAALIAEGQASADLQQTPANWNPHKLIVRVHEMVDS